MDKKFIKISRIVILLFFTLFIYAIIKADSVYSIPEYATNGCWLNDNCNYTLMGGGQPAINGSNASNGNDCSNYGWSIVSGGCAYDNIHVSNQTTSLRVEGGADERIRKLVGINSPVTMEFTWYDDDAGANEQFGFKNADNDLTGCFQQANDNDFIFWWDTTSKSLNLVGTDGSNEFLTFIVEYSPSTYWHIRMQNGTWFNTTDTVESSLDYLQISIDNGDVNIGEFRIWNGTIDNDPSRLVEESDTTPPTITLLYPTNNSYINNNIYIYGNVSDDVNITNVYTNDSRFDVYSGSTYNKSFYFNFSCSGGCATNKYSVNISVNDTSNNKAFVVANFTVDVDVPLLEILEPLNNRKYTNDTVNFTFICSDDNLFGYDVFIYNGSDYINYSHMRNITGNNYHWNMSFNLSAYPDGDYQFMADCVDGHTSNAINDYSVYKTDKMINIGDIYFSSSLSPNDLTYKKETDKYSYIYTFGTKTDYTFTLESNDIIYYMDNSKYKGHFITGNQWIDTEPYTPKSVKRISDYEYEIVLTGDVFNFRSIGDLNNESQTNDFTISRFLFVNVSWDAYYPTHDINIFNVTELSFTFNYSNSNNNQSYCTLYRNATNITTDLFDVGENNLTDNTLTVPLNISYDYVVSCFAFAEGDTVNTSTKTVNIANGDFVPNYLTYTTADRFNDFNRFLFIVFMFVIHFVLMYFGFRYANVFLLWISGLMGILASFTALTYLGIVYIFGASMFFVIYIIACIAGLYYVTPKEA